MAKRVARIGAIGATAAVALGGALLAGPAQAAPEGVGVNFLGHVCGTGNAGPEPTCTYTPTTNHSFGGAGPFTIVAKNADGSTAFSVNCADGEQCTDQGAGSIPAGSSVTITVTGPPGSVAAGAQG